MWSKVSVGSQGPVLSNKEVSVPKEMSVASHPNSPSGTAQPNQEEAPSDAL